MWPSQTEPQLDAKYLPEVKVKVCNLYAGLSKIEPHRGSSAEVETKTWQNYLPSAIARSSRQLLEL